MRNQTITATLIFSILLFISCNNSEKKFNEAEATNTLEAFKEFVQEFPNSEFTDLAKNKIDSIAYINTSTVNTEESFLRYCKEYSDSKYAAESQNNASTLRYKTVIKEPTKEGFQNLIADFPESVYVEEARKMIYYIETAQLVPDEIIFRDTSYTLTNPDFLDEAEPLYKDGLRMMTGRTINVEDGFKFLLVSMEFGNGLTNELSFDLDSIWVEVDNKHTDCIAYGVAYNFLRWWGHDMVSEGTFEPQSSTYFYKKLEWKNNHIKLSGIRRNWASIQFVFVVPASFKLKKINWYSLKLSERSNTDI